MSLRGTLSSQLDVIEQRVGGLLVRTQLGWFGIEPGVPGQILAYSDEGIPEWQNRANVMGVDTGWVNATLLNGWSNIGGEWPNASYRRTENNIVFVRGGVAGGGQGDSNPIFILPDGFRPEASYTDLNSGSDSNNRLVKAKSDGIVSHLQGSNTFVLFYFSYPLALI